MQVFTQWTVWLDFITKELYPKHTYSFSGFLSCSQELDKDILCIKIINKQNVCSDNLTQSRTRKIEALRKLGGQCGLLPHAVEFFFFCKVYTTFVFKHQEKTPRQLKIGHKSMLTNTDIFYKDNIKQNKNNCKLKEKTEWL